MKTMSSLVSICLDKILLRDNLYINDFVFLPVHMKNRILKRLTSIHSKSDKYLVFHNLVHPNLKEIDFSLYHIDDEIVKTISVCPLLQKLILTRHYRASVTETVLLQIIPNFKNLLIFHAPHCSAITDNVIKALVANCPNLTELDISNCENVTDASCTELAKLNKLEALNVSHLSITDEGITAYLKGPAKTILKELRLAECRHLSADGINAICKQCKSLQIFIFYTSINNDDLDLVKINFEDENMKNLKQLTWSVFW